MVSFSLLGADIRRIISIGERNVTTSSLMTARTEPSLTCTTCRASPPCRSALIVANIFGTVLLFMFAMVRCRSPDSANAANRLDLGDLSLFGPVLHSRKHTTNWLEPGCEYVTYGNRDRNMQYVRQQ